MLSISYNYICRLYGYGILTVCGNDEMIDRRMKLGDIIPDFSCDTDRGRIDSFYEWIGEGR